MKVKLGSRHLVRLVAALAALAVALALVPAAPAEPGKQKYILALGDSETAGTQSIAPAVEPGGSPATEVNRSGEGYADQLAERLESQGLRADLVNLACYYETTVTMIDGGGLCSYAHGSQLDEAEQFLHAHGKDVRAIVMSIGANDMLRNCALFAVACYAQQLAIAQTNLEAILTRLRAEGGDVPIAMVNYHNPFLAFWLLGLPEAAQLSVPLIVEPLSELIQNASAPFGVVFVDTLAAFQTENFNDLRPLPGVGDVPLNVWNICVFSWMCAHSDIHLNEAGYGLMAAEVARALNF